MDAAAADKLTATLVSLTNAWFDDHLYRFLERLQDNFHRRALDSRDDSEQQALLNQQQRIRSGHPPPQWGSSPRRSRPPVPQAPDEAADQKGAGRGEEARAEEGRQARAVREGEAQEEGEVTS